MQFWKNCHECNSHAKLISSTTCIYSLFPCGLCISCFLVHFPQKMKVSFWKKLSSLTFLILIRLPPLSPRLIFSFTFLSLILFCFSRRRPPCRWRFARLLSLWRLPVIGRTCLARQWLLPWTPASSDRLVQPTNDPPPAGPPTPPPHPPSGARALGGGSRSRRRCAGEPSWRARSQRKTVLYLLLPLSTSAWKTQYLK